ncbi:YqkE family protein [Rummeliibacillus sp. NPDC094406]|uniref:YqkE family protein n=1 Tax=Rummeliibacillus sp. NPDC094406 TaxID=3364511 RepID=UPI0037FD295D
MAKKKRQQRTQSQSKTVEKEENLTLQDQLNGEVLAKLKLAKKELVAKEQQQQEEKEAQLAFERKQREKNKSFAELLEEYGDKGTKF